MAGKKNIDISTIGKKNVQYTIIGKVSVMQGDILPEPEHQQHQCCSCQDCTYIVLCEQQNTD